MEHVQTNGLCEELEQMIGDGPGDIPGILDRIRQIESAFAANENRDVRNAASDAVHWIGIWRSPRRWKNWDDKQLRRIVLSCVVMLRRTLSSATGTGRN
jgi:hypothetical protein